MCKQGSEDYSGKSTQSGSKNSDQVLGIRVNVAWREAGK